MFDSRTTLLDEVRDDLVEIDSERLEAGDEDRGGDSSRSVLFVGGFQLRLTRLCSVCDEAECSMFSRD